MEAEDDEEKAIHKSKVKDIPINFPHNKLNTGMTKLSTDCDKQ